MSVLLCHMVTLTRFHACDVKIIMRAPIISCKSSLGISGNHVFMNDVRLRIIGTSGSVNNLPFKVE